MGTERSAIISSLKTITTARSVLEPLTFTTTLLDRCFKTLDRQNHNTLKHRFYQARTETGGPGANFYNNLCKCGSLSGLVISLPMTCLGLEQVQVLVRDTKNMQSVDSDNL